MPLLLAFLAGGCGEGAPGQRHQQERIGDPEARGDVLPVMGTERRITVLKRGRMDGRGLSADESYPSLLERALRARGVNARVTSARSAEEALAVRAELVVTDDPEAGQALARGGARPLVVRVALPDALLQADRRHPIAQGAEEMVAQSVEQVAAALPERL